MIIKMQEDSNIREVFMKQHTTEYSTGQRIPGKDENEKVDCVPSTEGLK